jgi:P-type Mg2+ transporter
MHRNKLAHQTGTHFSDQLVEKARADSSTVLKELGSQASGLSAAEADSRLRQYGPNEIAREKQKHPKNVFRSL